MPTKSYDYDKPNTERVYYYFEKPTELLLGLQLKHLLKDNMESTEPLFINISMTMLLGFLSMVNNVGTMFLATETILSMFYLLK